MILDTVTQEKAKGGGLKSEMFQTLPSRKQYPDYYKVIEKPLDLTQIQGRISKDQYSSVDDCLTDLDLVFNNAQTYNEEGSSIYQDAVALQTIARDTIKKSRKRRRSSTVGSATKTKAPTQAVASETNAVDEEKQEAWQNVYNAVRSHTEKDRRLSDIVYKMPPQKDTWFHDVVTVAVDLVTIQQRLKDFTYPDNVAFLADLVLALTNAMVVHSPGTQQHEDAQRLVQVCAAHYHSLTRFSGTTAGSQGVSSFARLPCYSNVS